MDVGKAELWTSIQKENGRIFSWTTDEKNILLFQFVYAHFYVFIVKYVCFRIYY